MNDKIPTLDAASPHWVPTGTIIPLMFEGSVCGRARLTKTPHGAVAVIEGNVTDYIPQGVITDPSPGVLIYQGRDMEGTGSP